MKGNAGSLSGRGGSMEEEDARTAQNMQGPNPLRGGLSDAGPATPEYNQRLREREDFINEQYNRDAAFMIENAERKGKRIPSDGAEVLRRTAADKAEQRKIDSINALYQAGSGPSGKIPPERAQQIYQLTGQMPPASIVGAGREDANDLIRQHAASINAQRTRLESDMMTADSDANPYAAELRKMIREKGDVLGKMQAKLNKKNVDYQQVVDELTAAMSNIDLKYSMSETVGTSATTATGQTDSTDGVALDEKGNPIRRSGR